MSTQSSRIKTFMQTLDASAAGGMTGLDEAVRACSRFSSAQDWIDSFVNERSKYASGTAFLQGACGIDLSNSDTGSILGSDAGGSTALTAESVVPETAAAVNSVSSASFKTHGLTVSYANYNLSSDSLNSAASHLIYYSKLWWVDSALSLIEDAYGMNFSESGTKMNNLTIGFTEVGNDYLAQTSSRNGTMLMSYNMDDCVGINTYNGSSKDGRYSYSDYYLDRVTAHELTHAVMFANVNNTNELPQFLMEGLAELISGADDARAYYIEELADNTEELSSCLDLNDTSTGNSPVYAAGYMALRYLAQSGGTSQAVFVPSSKIYYTSDYSTVVIGTGVDADVYLDGRELQYNSAAVRIDATAANGSLRLAGNSSANTILGGQGSTEMWGGTGSNNDVLWGGSGADVFDYGAGDGDDIIGGYDAAKDTISLYHGLITDVQTASGSVVLQLNGSQSLTVKDAANTSLVLREADVGQTYKIWFGQTGTSNTVTFDNSVDYYRGSTTSTDTMLITGAASVYMNNLGGKYYDFIDTLDAGTSAEKVILAGSSSANTIKAGSGGSELWGGTGASADVLYGGNGVDRFYYGTGEGKDTIVNGSVDDVVYFYSADYICTEYHMDGNNLVVSSLDGNSLTIRDWTETSLNTFDFADGHECKIVRTANGLTDYRTK